MIYELQTSIFTSPAQIITNPVNIVAVMGSGLALEFKNKYPKMFEVYKNICNNNMLTTGNPYFYKGENKVICLFPTKQHFNQDSKLEWIEEGLKKIESSNILNEFGSIAFPKLGCGLGGLNWEDQVKPLMEIIFSKNKNEIYIHV